MHDFVEPLKAMNMRKVLSAPRLPWQCAHVERSIGTIRSECLDHVLILRMRSLCHHAMALREYSHAPRTHLSLQKDSLQVAFGVFLPTWRA